MIYLNIKTALGVETVDELRRQDFPTFREWKQELRRLIGEYHSIGCAVYPSRRSTREWRESQ